MAERKIVLKSPKMIMKTTQAPQHSHLMLLHVLVKKKVIAKFLDGKVLVKSELVCRWVRDILTLDSVWKNALLRDLKVADPGVELGYKWKEAYAKAFDGSHSFNYPKKDLDNHIGWFKAGAFIVDSEDVLLTANLSAPLRIPAKEMVATPMKTGIWVADLHILRCTCHEIGCDRMIRVLEVRHIELFLSDGYKNATLRYELLGSHEGDLEIDGRVVSVFDLKHMEECCSTGILDLDSWEEKEDNMEEPLKPKFRLAKHAVAVHFKELLPCWPYPELGYEFEYLAMRAADDKKIVSLRILHKVEHDI